MKQQSPEDRAVRQDEIAGVVQRNIHDLYEHREKHKKKLTLYERIANRIAEYCGSAQFVVANALFFLVWILLNVGWFGIRPFDPFPFGLLTTIVSLEAIFLSLFVLLSQNRMQKLSDQQSELDVQVSLLAEHELTRVLVAVDLIAQKLGIDLPEDGEKDELKSDTAPQAVLEEIERKQEEQDQS
ncbi:MAG: DUF1003 domain-containing protein [Armatimonadetes bacterium]|nr:DUF1003 domain-containing protein [Armatimonadota bacterium]